MFFLIRFIFLNCHYVFVDKCNDFFLNRKILILLILLGLAGCSEKEESADKPVVPKKEKKINKDSIDRVKKEKEYDRFPEIKYHKVKIKNNKHRNQLLYEYRENPNNPLKNQIFCTINRKARHYMRVGDTVIVPDTIIKDKRAYSVFPQYYHGAKNIPKLIVMSNLYQAYAAYEYGVQVHFAAVNTGKEKTPTYPGKYHLTWKNKLRISSLDSTWKMPFTWNFHRYAGSAFHKFTMPGYPASHSCARQFIEDAEWLFYWGEGSDYVDGKPIDDSGTPVIIIDVYDFTLGKKGPWTRLNSSKDFVLELPDNPLAVEEPYIPISQIPAGARRILPNKERYMVAEDTLKARGWVREHVTLTPSVNFNKIRRQKRLAEKKKKEEEGKNKINEVRTTDIEEIKKNLEFLERKEIEINPEITPKSNSETESEEPNK